jgi:glycine N-methyltransferase
LVYEDENLLPTEITARFLTPNRPKSVQYKIPHKVYYTNFSHFRLSYYPHRLAGFKRLLKRTFGSCAEHCVFADFKPLSEEPNPAFYIHVIEKHK